MKTHEIHAKTLDSKATALDSNYPLCLLGPLGLLGLLGTLGQGLATSFTKKWYVHCGEATPLISNFTQL